MSFDYTTLVFDRTTADLTNGSAKGYLNATDLQRINNACVDLGSRLNAAGIAVKLKPSKSSWGVWDYTETAVGNLLYNVTLLRTKLPLPETTPPTPSSLDRPTIEAANDIEHILFDVNTVLIEYERTH